MTKVGVIRLACLQKGVGLPLGVATDLLSRRLNHSMHHSYRGLRVGCLPSVVMPDFVRYCYDCVATIINSTRKVKCVNYNNIFMVAPPRHVTYCQATML